MRQNSTFIYMGENNTEGEKNISDLEKIRDELDSKKDKINQNEKIDEKLNFDNFFEIFFRKDRKFISNPKKRKTNE